MHTPGLHRIVQMSEHAYKVQKVERVAWADMPHDEHDKSIVWETAQMAAAYLCGVSHHWVRPLSFAEAMQRIVVEEQPVETLRKDDRA